MSDSGDSALVAALGEEAAGALPGALAASLGDAVDVVDLRRLSGGASRQTWRADLSVGGVATPVILQQERPGSEGASIPMATQCALLRAAAQVGVPVPAVLAEVGAAGRAVVGLQWRGGESLAPRLLRDDEYAEVRPVLAAEAGRILAAVHRIPLDAVPSGTPQLRGGDPLEQARLLLDLLGEPHPAFEIGLRRLEQERPAPREEVVVHGDFRMGNLLVDTDGVTAVLDWELAHLGSAVEDLGWFCCRAWRFGAAPEAGGVGTLEELLAGYGEGGGDVPPVEEVRWWEAYGTLRWGLICVLQAGTHLRGHHRSVELAAIGRRAAECEEDLLALLFGASDYEPAAAEEVAPPAGPHDRPTAVELLEAVGEHLAGLRGQLSGAAAFHTRVAGNVVDMVAREVVLGPGQGAAHAERLARLGSPDNATLAGSVRAGERDGELDTMAAVVREDVRDKLAVARPGYWHVPSAP